jgi:hypothetical protein
MAPFTPAPLSWPTPQYVGEERTRWFTFASTLQPGDSILSMTLRATPAGLILINPGIGPDPFSGADGQMVQFAAQCVALPIADSDSQQFVIECEAVTMLGEQPFGVAILTVQALPIAPPPTITKGATAFNYHKRFNAAYLAL